MPTKKISDSTFQQDVLDADQPVLVDFWAEWCGPCKAIGPVLEEAADELDGKVTIAKLNIDDNPDTPGKYRVRSIPTLMLFKNGEPQEIKVGGMPKAELVDWLESVA